MLVLVLRAMVLTVVFATRGALAGNRHIIEVLHFVGAEARFVAREFQKHFLLISLKGAVAGGALAVVVFIVFSLLVVAQPRDPAGRPGDRPVRHFRHRRRRLSRHRRDVIVIAR